MIHQRCRIRARIDKRSYDEFTNLKLGRVLVLLLLWGEQAERVVVPVNGFSVIITLKRFFMIVNYVSRRTFYLSV